MNQNTLERPARFTGIDVSDLESTYVTLAPDGSLVAEGKVPTTKKGFDDLLQGQEASRIAFEAGTHSCWIARHIDSMGHEVVVANPRQIPLISKSRKKTDRNDAKMLAQLVRADTELLSPVYVRSEKSLAARTLVRARKALVGTRTRLVNLVRTECKVHGVRVGSSSSTCFHRAARAVVPEILEGALLPLLEELEHLTAQISRYDREIERLGKAEFPETACFRDVTGVGPQVALMYAATIEDPRRFSDSRLVGAYVGLVPRSYQSGTNDPNLRISKQGDGELRSLLVNAATHIMRQSAPDSSLKRFGKRVAGRGNPRDKARARIAVARKLAVILHRLWLTGEVYEPLRAT